MTRSAKNRKVQEREMGTWFGCHRKGRDSDRQREREITKKERRMICRVDVEGREMYSACEILKMKGGREEWHFEGDNMLKIVRGGGINIYLYI